MKTACFKPVALMVLSVTCFSFCFSTAQASPSKATCKVETNDIGTIVGQGRSPSAAFEDAAEKCFDRRSQLYKMKKGSSVDEDTGLVMIDMCANIKCKNNG
jgi:hypothetical protein